MARAMSTEPSNPTTILVVDDNEANRPLARGDARGRGLRVVLATGGRGRDRRRFEPKRRTASCSTCGCPRSTASRRAKRSARCRAGPETPILFLTALRDVDTFDRALRAGGDDFPHEARSPDRARRPRADRAQAAADAARASRALRAAQAAARRPDAPQLQKERSRRSSSTT